MNYLERTFWSSEKNCVLYLQQHDTFWINIPMLSTLIGLLIANEKSIDDAVLVQNQNKDSGVVDKKKEQTMAFIKRCYRLDRKLTLFAKRTNNQVLLKDADISEATFLESGINAATNTCTAVITLGRKYLAQTADYGITSQELDALETELVEIKKLPAEAQVNKNEHKTTTHSIKQLVVTAHSILDQLDDGLEGMIEDQDFINGWFEARKIKGRHIPPPTLPKQPTPPTPPKA
jgi:hypothetical protein